MVDAVVASISKLPLITTLLNVEDPLEAVTLPVTSPVTPPVTAPVRLPVTLPDTLPVRSPEKPVEAATVRPVMFSGVVPPITLLLIVPPDIVALVRFAELLAVRAVNVPAAAVAPPIVVPLIVPDVMAALAIVLDAPLKLVMLLNVADPLKVAAPVLVCVPPTVIFPDTAADTEFRDPDRFASLNLKVAEPRSTAPVTPGSMTDPVSTISISRHTAEPTVLLMQMYQRSPV